MKKIIISGGIVVVCILLVIFFINNKKQQNAIEILSPIEINQNNTQNTITKNIEIDSKIIRESKKVGGFHTGTINIQKGELFIQDDKIIGGNIIIDMTSIDIGDVKNIDTKNSLIKHLSSEDFFNVLQYPTSILKIAYIKDNYAIGNLTIKNITNTVKLPITITNQENKTIISSNFNIDRTKRGITYLSTNLIDTIKDKAIDNLINIQFNIKTQ